MPVLVALCSVRDDGPSAYTSTINGREAAAKWGLAPGRVEPSRRCGVDREFERQPIKLLSGATPQETYTAETNMQWELNPVPPKKGSLPCLQI